jgi:hypothetical protein
MPKLSESLGLIFHVPSCFLDHSEESLNEALGVSIIVVNYNNDQFLDAAINSALAQTHSRCEVIVVDD